MFSLNRKTAHIRTNDTRHLARLESGVARVLSTLYTIYFDCQGKFRDFSKICLSGIYWLRPNSSAFSEQRFYQVSLNPIKLQVNVSNVVFPAGRIVRTYTITRS
jgi:hypothetical protein